jgi:NAD(P)-dependent dehydrogenase (short-subunit alcohol dehydrogenase family)
MADALRLFGLRAVVTDAGGGIGEALVRTLVKHGAEVLAIDSINSGIETHFKGVRGVRGAPIDLNSADAATRVGEVAATELGVVDIVICNISLRSDGPISDGDDEALSNLLKRKNDLVDGTKDGTDSYAKSEAAIAELTRRLAAQTAEFGINANYIQLGAIMTPESRRVFNSDKELRDFCIQRSAAKRLGEPVDVAKVALFLATDDSVFVSGTGIMVDGGVASV